MTTETITIRSTLNGQIAEVSPSVLDNPHLAKYFVRVTDENPKPMILATPSTAEEFVARREGYEKSKGKKNLKTEDTPNTEEG